MSNGNDQWEETDVQDLRQGLVDTPQLSSVPGSAASVFTNAELTDIGIRRRYGRLSVGAGGPSGAFTTHIVNQGMTLYRPVAPLIAANANQMIHAQGLDTGPATFTYAYWNSFGTFKGAVSDAVPATAADIIGSDLRVGGFFQYNDYLFYWDGGSIHRYYDGVGTHGIFTWGFDSSILVLGTNGASAAGGGKTDAKAYQWVYTWYNPLTGAETDPSPASASNTPASPNLQWTITVPANAAWTAEWSMLRIYSTFGDATGTYFFEREVTAGPLDTTAKVITNGMSKADGELGAEVETDNAPPGKLLYCILFQEKVIAVDFDDPNSIVWSKEQNPFSWPPINRAYIEKDSGSVITGLFVLLGKLYVVKRHGGVFMLTPATDGTWVVDKVMDKWGCANHHGIVVVGPYAYWLETKGAVRFDGQGIEDITDPRIRQTFRQYSRGLIKTLDGTREITVYGIHDWQPDRNYIRWLVKNQADQVTHHLIYDISLNAWMVSKPIDALDAGSSERSASLMINEYTAERYVLTGDADGHCFEHTYQLFSSDVPKLFTDNGEAYLFEVRSRWFGDGIHDILPIYVEFELGQSILGKTTAPLTVEFYRDTTDALPYTQNYTLYDSSISSKRSQTYRMNLNARTCKRFAVGFKCDGINSDVHILNFRVIWAMVGKRLLGI